MEIKELTKGEMEIMRVIWDHDGMFLSDIIAAIPEPRPAYTTVSTVVRVLVNKGFLNFEQFGKSNRYKAAISKEEYSHQAIAQIQSNLFGGSCSEMLSFFAKRENLTSEERRELLALLSDDKE